MRIFKRITDKTLTFAVIAALIVAMLLCAFSFSIGTHAYADEIEDIKEFETVSLGLTNTDFGDTSGSYPATPTGWAGEHTDGGSGNVVAGVVDLTAKNYVGENSGNKKFKLDQYPEYADEAKTPATIFGANSNDYPDSDAKALLVNTAPGVEAAYAFSSSDMTFEANSFYHVSAWVKTGSFTSGTGATIKLSGLGENCSFINIDTVSSLDKTEGDTPVPALNEGNKYGWMEYEFYVRTSPSLKKTVKLVLGIGDAVTDSDEDAEGVMPRPAHGYAFFDFVKAERISAQTFAFSTADFTRSDDRDNVYYYNSTFKKSLALDLYNTKYLTDGGDPATEIGTFSNGLNGWNVSPVYNEDDEDVVSSGSPAKAVYNAYRTEDINDNEYGFTQNPWSPLGKAEDTTLIGSDHPMFVGKNSNILLISTYDKTGKKFDTAAGGVASPDVVIKRFKYYRFGVWTKADSVNGGNGISIGVKGQSNVAADNNKLNQWYNNLTGDAADTAHYGWKEQVVYIKGSNVKDCTVHFELWLGAPSAQSSGIAMFDNVTFTEVSYSEYTEMSGADGGNVLTLDTAKDATGVDNGTFENVGDYEEFKFPLPVANWTYNTPDTVTAVGFSSNKVDTENAVHGIIPSDRELFDSIYSEGGLTGVIDPSTLAHPAIGNVLLLSSTTPTAFCYKSPNLTASTDKANKITVEMAVNSVRSGYGASLVLKTEDGSVISTIENIKDTHNDYKTYTFYLNAPLSDQTVYLEIWLGLNDRKNNTQKLSEGNVYVKQVAMSEWTAAEDSSIDVEFADIFNKYKTAISNPDTVKNLDYGVYSFTDPSLNYYDAYTYNAFGGYGSLYKWSVTSENTDNFIGGIFNTENMRALSLYEGFDKKDYSGNMLIINNTAPNRTVFTYGNTLSLVANTYYRLDITLKLRLSDEMKNSDKTIGATLSLLGKSTEKFENIKDTTTLVSKNNEESRDKETFKTYSFYISTGADGGDLGLSVALGGSSKSSMIQGQLVIADIKLDTINNTVYEAAEKDENNAYAKCVAFASETTDTDGTDAEENGDDEKPTNDIAWWIIPTVIFGAALIVAIAIILIIRLRDRFKKKKKVTYTSEYDRSSVSKRIDELNKLAEEDEKKKSEQATEETSDGEPENQEEAVEEQKDEAAAEEPEATAENAEAEEPKAAEKEPEKPESLDD